MEWAIEGCWNRTGRYLEYVLTDNIYRDRENSAYCNLYRIRFSENAHDRPKKDNKVEKKNTLMRLTVSKLKETSV